MFATIVKVNKLIKKILHFNFNYYEICNKDFSKYF